MLLRYPLCLFTGGLLIKDTPFVPGRPWKYTTVAVYLAVYALLMFWTFQVKDVVPEPYLDEVFHIPQAQAYCDARYDVWDPKLTTPPGLYIVSTIFTKIWWKGMCSPFTLRIFNTIALLMTMSYALDCRLVISKICEGGSPSTTSKWLQAFIPVSLDALHTAANITLFPPLFFFSGLFYTDVLSTCLVLRAYKLFLERRGAYANSTHGLVWMYPAGILALIMRQTNIFWVAVFMGGLEAARTIKSGVASSTAQLGKPWEKQNVSELWKKYSHGYIHDILLRDASVRDFILTAISIAVAIMYNPIRILTRLWPYIALLVSFGAFVLWNGGVVLGDKSNHIPTLHLAQILYLSAFTAFFSLPLLIPPFLSSLHSILYLLKLPSFPRLTLQYILVAVYATGAMVAMLATIHFNTIIHPFTLADNRHYTFYAFRYTILRHWCVRYLLAPIYALSGWACYITLCAPPTPAMTQKQRIKARTEDGNIIDDSNVAISRVEGEQGPSTSLLLIYALATILSLVTAPLVEPRYFILPWVVWRLHVPTSASSSSSSSPSSSSSLSKNTTTTNTITKFLHDYRLPLETAWFLLINAVTGYMFLYRGFEWKEEEPGRVQRFMW